MRCHGICMKMCLCDYRCCEKKSTLILVTCLSHSCPKVIVVNRMQSVSRPDDEPAPGDDHNAALNVSEDHDK